MNPRQFLLLVCSALLILFFLNLPISRWWLHERILNFTDDIYDELDRMDYESRRVYRFGNTYEDAVALKKFIDSKGAGAPLLLMPPADYKKAKKIQGEIPEPIILYYYTGLKATWMTGKDVYKANWGLVAAKGELHLVSLADKKAIDTLIYFYKHPEKEI